MEQVGKGTLPNLLTSIGRKIVLVCNIDLNSHYMMVTLSSYVLLLNYIIRIRLEYLLSII